MEEFNSIADYLGENFKGEIVQLYLGETNKLRKYSDYDVDQKVYIEGRVKQSKGNIIIIECTLPLDKKTGKKKKVEVILNSWNIKAVMKKVNNVKISSLLSMESR